MCNISTTLELSYLEQFQVPSVPDVGPLSRQLLASPERGGSGWVDNFAHSLSGALRVVDYAAVRRVVRFS